MNVRDFETAYKKLMDLWPLTYAFIESGKKSPNPTLSTLLYSRIGERVGFEEFCDGVNTIATLGGNHEPSDVIRAINDVINKRARSTSATKQRRHCTFCDGTGFVQAKSRDGYDYAFRCPDSCKPVSNSIPLWDHSYELQGYTRFEFTQPKQQHVGGSVLSINGRAREATVGNNTSGVVS